MANDREEPVTPEVEAQLPDGEQGYSERDLQLFLRMNPDGLGIPNAKILACEYQTAVGRIDLLVSDGPRKLWVVELKAVVADRDAIGQIMSYIGAVRDLHPDKAVVGILVAPDFDDSCLAAHRAIGDVELKKVRVHIEYILEPAASMIVHKGQLPTVSSDKPLVYTDNSGRRFARCRSCGTERELSPGAQAFSCAACKTFNVF